MAIEVEVKGISKVLYDLLYDFEVTSFALVVCYCFDVISPFLQDVF